MWQKFIPLTFTCLSALGAQTLQDLTTPTPIPPGETLIVGFLGAWERWDDAHRGVRKLALRLRKSQIPGLHVETFGNHQRGVALDFIRAALDRDHDGFVDSRERASLRIILYGQSLGGRAVVRLARELDLMGVPVELTVQIDSVGLDDSAISANVHYAANLYQHERLSIQGRSEINADDPIRTKIIANVRWHPEDTRRAPETWLRRRFGGAHALMEADPRVWARVERWILDAVAQHRM